MNKFLLSILCATFPFSYIQSDEMAFIRDHFETDLHDHLKGYKYLKKQEKDPWYWYKMGYLEAMLNPEEGRAFLEKISKRKP